MMISAEQRVFPKKNLQFWRLSRREKQEKVKKGGDKNKRFIKERDL